MATLKSTNINSGDPVTADVINNIILDLNELNKSTAASFSLTLGSTGSGTSNANTTVSQKVYSTTVSNVSVDPSKKPSGKGSWTFPAKAFTQAPKCWIQVNTNGVSLTEAQLRVHPVITSISTTKMTFEVRSGSGAAPAKMNFDIFAVE